MRVGQTIRRVSQSIPLTVLSMFYATGVAIHGFVSTSLGLSLSCSGEPFVERTSPTASPLRSSPGSRDCY
jgi:hypothetical protein